LASFTTRASIVLQRPVQLARDAVLAVVGQVPRRRQMTMRMAGR
jgi:hypothetical protein